MAVDTPLKVIYEMYCETATARPAAFEIDDAAKGAGVPGRRAAGAVSASINRNITINDMLFD